MLCTSPVNILDRIEIPLYKLLSSFNKVAKLRRCVSLECLGWKKLSHLKHQKLRKSSAFLPFWKLNTMHIIELFLYSLLYQAGGKF